MKTLFTAVLALSLPAAASIWKSEAGHSTATFAAKHMMVSTVRGTMGAVNSTIDLDDKDVTKHRRRRPRKERLSHRLRQPPLLRRQHLRPLLNQLPNRS